MHTGVPVPAALRLSLRLPTPPCPAVASDALALGAWVDEGSVRPQPSVAPPALSRSTIRIRRPGAGAAELEQAPGAALASSRDGTQGGLWPPAAAFRAVTGSPGVWPPPPPTHARPACVDPSRRSGSPRRAHRSGSGHLRSPGHRRWEREHPGQAGGCHAGREEGARGPAGSLGVRLRSPGSATSRPMACGPPHGTGARPRPGSDSCRLSSAPRPRPAPPPVGRLLTPCPAHPEQP